MHPLIAWLGRAEPKRRRGCAAAPVFLIALAVLGFGPHAWGQQFSDWSVAVNLGPVVNSSCSATVTTCDDQHPALSKDGLSLYFSSDRPGGFGGLDIWVSQRASVNDPWKRPVNLGPNINTSSDEVAATFSTDGHLLFFHSNRPGGCGARDLYFSRRKDRRDDFGWQPAGNLDLFGRDPSGPLPCIVNTAFSDAGPTYFDGESRSTVLYFTSTRPGLGDFDIYITRLRPDGTWGVASLVPELSSPFRDTRTAIRRRDGLEMILSSERPGGLGRHLWVSTRPTTSSLWSRPVLLGANVNSSALDGGPALSWDATTLIFFSARGEASAGNDLFMSTRTRLTAPK